MKREYAIVAIVATMDGCFLENRYHRPDGLSALKLFKELKDTFGAGMVVCRVLDRNLSEIARKNYTAEIGVQFANLRSWDFNKVHEWMDRFW